MDCKVVCVTAALLAAGCVPREEGTAAVAWADQGGTFLGVVQSYVPTSEMFGRADGRAGFRTEFFEQDPVTGKRTRIGPVVELDLGRTAYFMKSAGYVLYQEYALEQTGDLSQDFGAWKERALADGVDRVVSAPEERPAGMIWTDVVPSWTGAYRAVLFRGGSTVNCELEVRERSSGAKVLTRSFECSGDEALHWQPDDSLVVTQGLLMLDERFRVRAPGWIPEPVGDTEQVCELGTSSGQRDVQGRELDFDPFDTRISVLEVEKPAGCGAP